MRLLHYSRAMPQDLEESIVRMVMEFEGKSCISKVLKVEMEPASALGDNFVSDVQRLKLKVMLHSGDIEDRSFICKCLSGSENHQQMYSTVFQKEIKVLSEILPSMQKIIRQHSYGEECFYPQLYGSQEKEKLFIKDLKPLGYTTAGYRNGLDFEHCAIFLKMLGRVHATGAILIQRGELVLDEFYFYKFEDDFDLATDIFKKSFEKFASIAKNDWKGEWVQFGERLRQAGERVNTLKEVFERSESRFNTFLHGDLWNSNIMFRHDIEGNPTSVRLLDWQMCWYNSVGFDLHYFLWTSAHTDVRPRKAELIQLYHESLSRHLRLYGYAKEPPSLEDISAEYDRTAPFGLVTSISFLDFMMQPKKFGEAGGKGYFSSLINWDHDDSQNFKRTMQYIIKEAAEIGLI